MNRDPSLRFIQNDPRRRKYKVSILFDNEQIYVGMFRSKDEAVAARDRKAIELWGFTLCDGCEKLLPTPFLTRFRGQELCEGCLCEDLPPLKLTEDDLWANSAISLAEELATDIYVSSTDCKPIDKNAVKRKRFGDL